MPSRVLWLIPTKLIHLELLDFVTTDEVTAHMREIENWVQNSNPSTVHVIVDFRKASYIPTNIRFMTQVSRPLAGFPNLGHMIILGPKLPLIATIATVVSQIVRFRYKSAKTFDEALNYLQGVDPELEPAI